MAAEGRHWMWVRLDKTLATMQDILSSDVGVKGSLEALIREDAVRRIMDAKPEEFTHTYEVQRMYYLLGALLWLSGREIEERVQ